MIQYQELLNDVLTNGRRKSDRTGTGTRAVFGRQMRMNLSEGFPLLTTKKVFFRGVVEELLWFLSGDTNEHTLRDKGVNIWKEWADPETGELGRVYGAQWRRWRSVGGSADEGDYGEAYSAKVTDQIADLLCDLKANPTSRRHIVTAWNPGELDQMALPPCHCLFQFYCEELTLSERVPLFDSRDRDKMFQVEPLDQLDNPRLKALEEAMDKRNIPRYRLSCQLYQRSADIFLGVPFNIASYALLTHMVAQVVNMVPGDFVHTFGDLHLYNNHVEQAELQLSRSVRPLPRLTLNPDVADLFQFKSTDITLEGYDPHPAISAPVSV